MFDIEIPLKAQRLLREARMVQTACGAGHTVWRLWGAGEPLVMLHGGAGSWTHWIHNIDAVVAAGRLACVPDLPGFGESDVPAQGRDADAVVQPIAEGMRAICGDAPVQVAAFSFGSLVGTLLAARIPERVSRLVLVGAPVVPLPNGKGVPLKGWAHLPTQAQRDEVHRFNLAALMLHRPESIDATAVAVQALNVPRDRMPRRKMVTTHAFRDALAQVQCEFSAIYGAQDALYRGDWTEVMSTLRSNPLSGGITLIPDAGHWVQFEEPDIFNRELLSVIAG